MKYNITKRGPDHGCWKGGRHIRADGYVYIYAPDHPKASASSGRYVYEHVLVVEAVCGRSLPDHAVVHHINEDPTDNRPENLLVCDRSYHVLIHQRLRAKKACGNPDWLRCEVCKEYDASERMWLSPTRTSRARHRECHTKLQKERYWLKRWTFLRTETA